MKRTMLLLALLAMVVMANAQAQKRVLVFKAVQGYFHQSIPAGVKAIQQLGAENNFAVDVAPDSTYFTDANLKKYAAIIFCNTSGRRLFTADQQAAIRRYIQAGGGFMGIHCAGCNYSNLKTGDVDWPWYHQLVGATFTEHPAPQTAQFDVLDQKNAATAHLPTRWTWYEELYNFKDIQPDINVILKVDETTYKGGKLGANHPMAWYHEFDGGRAFYTALGHFEQAYTKPEYLKHILGGIQYAMGKNVVLKYKN
jgi:type 1 glutamine amidotransferase